MYVGMGLWDPAIDLKTAEQGVFMAEAKLMEVVTTPEQIDAAENFARAAKLYAQTWAHERLRTKYYGIVGASVALAIGGAVGYFIGKR